MLTNCNPELVKLYVEYRNKMRDIKMLLKGKYRSILININRETDLARLKTTYDEAMQFISEQDKKVRTR